MKATRYIGAALLACLSLTAVAETGDKYEKWGPTSESGAGVIVRLGYTLGGTTPVPLPNEIRSINAFSPHGGATIAADVYKMLCKRWGISVGWHFFYEGFHTSADVKNYKMSLTQEGNTMSGYFTGCDVTNVGMWGLTMPVLATWRLSPRWNISAGPFFTVFYSQSFDGQVYDNKQGVGYLR
ncbi:MAG: outer membrane beta-barrel protein, partial [Prevotellaceae bacterium]|nr:outer membrane beta-barrel protein [Prevotellaceae bacterium]